MRQYLAGSRLARCCRSSHPAHLTASALAAPPPPAPAPPLTRVTACKPAGGCRCIQAPPRVGPHAIAAGQRSLVLALKRLARQILQPRHRARAAAGQRAGAVSDGWLMLRQAECGSACFACTTHCLCLQPGHHQQFAGALESSRHTLQAPKLALRKSSPVERGVREEQVAGPLARGLAETRAVYKPAAAATREVPAFGEAAANVGSKQERRNSYCWPQVQSPVVALGHMVMASLSRSYASGNRSRTRTSAQLCCIHYHKGGSSASGTAASC